MQNLTTWALVACIATLPVLAVSAMAAPAYGEYETTEEQKLDDRAAKKGYDVSRHRAAYLATTVGMSDIAKVVLEDGEWKLVGLTQTGTPIAVGVSARNGRIIDVDQG
ncbi:MAG: hypothetical protein SGJ21_02660 [Alphaproteobacteria bacterium]|mgnify:CR=1 FL=1|nr:hypothetical protein [Alphaproteobacteria bacterium]